MLSAKGKLINIAAFLCGVGLLGYFVHVTGADLLWSNLRTLGEGLLWVVLIYQASVMLEVGAWQLAVPRERRTDYFTMYASAVAGSSLNQLFPGGQAGEVLKGNLLRRLVPSQQIVASLVMFNFLFTATTLPVLLVGAIMCLGAGEVPLEVSLGLLGGVGVTALLTWLVFLWLRRGMVADLLNLVRRVPYLGRKLTEDSIKKGRLIDDEVRNFRRHRPRDFLLCSALLVLARLAAVLEIWVIVALLGGPVSAGVAAGLFAAGQLFYYLALFLPTRIGVLEGGSILVFTLFGLPGGLGLATEFVRTIRKVIFCLVGLGLWGWLEMLRKRPPAPLRAQTLEGYR